MNQVITQSFEQETTRGDRAIRHRISIGAVFAGIITALIIQLLLTLLGVGIGAASIEPLRERSPAEGIGMGAAIWFFVSGLIAMYVGGRVAGNLSGTTTKRDRMVHGIFTWA